MKSFKRTLQRELKLAYRGPDKAYSALDFSGRGFILQEDFISSVVVARVSQGKVFNSGDLLEYFKNDNLFGTTGTALTFDKFKKTFFPKLFLIDESEESEDEKRAKQSKVLLKADNVLNDDNKELFPENVLAERLKKLERILKEKFANQWESVRKAFLALDSDHDGFITVEDILRHFS
jgi:hypothetical protein